jgi:hypothetical protein
MYCWSRVLLFYLFGGFYRIQLSGSMAQKGAFSDPKGLGLPNGLGHALPTQLRFNQVPGPCSVLGVPGMSNMGSTQWNGAYPLIRKLLPIYIYMYVWNNTRLYTCVNMEVWFYMCILYTYICNYYIYIHTLHYITSHYSTLHYITCIYYIHVYMHNISF